MIFNSYSHPNRAAFVSVSDALQLMLDFGSFVVMLISLVVELIKFFDQRKNNCFGLVELAVI
ncbi:putative holin-like toxin [Lactobacillus helveticus]|uniref:putative holin-like toxin n=1 Tax=Lactobacillus helveticus TaxID=1587 RepID=UPI0027DA8039|nr:putative holin-like toxin [Lactobacillus helveticus]